MFSQGMMEVPYHADNDISEHVTGSGSSPEHSASEIHREMELCSDLHTKNCQVQAAAFSTDCNHSVIQTH